MAAEAGGVSAPTVVVQGGRLQPLAGGRAGVVVEVSKLLVTNQTRPVLPRPAISVRP